MKLYFTPQKWVLKNKKKNEKGHLVRPQSGLFYKNFYRLFIKKNS